MGRVSATVWGRARRAKSARTVQGNPFPMSWSNRWATVFRKRRPVRRVKEKRKGPRWHRIR
jgi:hypothetical protein